MRNRKNYKFYRIFAMNGTKRMPPWFDPTVCNFLQEHGVDPENRRRWHDVPGGSERLFIQIMDETPIEQRPHRVVLADPVGRTIRVWSRVASWNR